MKQNTKYLSLCLAGGACASAVMAQQRPHIILIVTDQQRADALGCMNNPAVISPNIDGLAHDGYLFRHAYTAAPSSTPARATLLTGQSPWHHGMLGYGATAELYEYEMPQMLRDLGYHTLGIGKMHWHPQRSLRGFEATLLDESGRVEDPYFVSDYRKWFATQAFGCNPDSTGVGWNAHMARAYALPERLHPTVWTGDQAVQAINGYSSDSPLFLKVSFARPHSPYDPPQRLVDLYEGRKIPAPAVGEWCGDVPVDPEPDSKPEAARGNFGAGYAKRSRQYYYAAVTFIDEQVGRIVQALKDRGMYDNAVICFVSDHGDMLGDHHLWRKTYAYEGSAGIPYIVKLPRDMQTVLPAGSEVQEPVGLEDLLPTFLGINGQPVPSAMDGMSLQALWNGRQSTWRTYIAMEHNTSYFADNYWCALTDGKTKYIWFFRSGKEQLFDLTRDPHELHDLSTVSRHRKQLARMRQAMVEYLSERGEGWVKDGRLVVREKDMLYSPNFPKNKKK